MLEVDPTKARVEPRVSRLTHAHYRRDDRLFPKGIAEEFPEWEEVYAVYIGYRWPSGTEQTMARFFGSRQEAEKFLAEAKVGSKLPIEIPSDDDVIGPIVERMVSEQLETAARFGLFSAGEEDSFLPLNVLSEAGVSDGVSLTPEVVAFLGDQRIEELKEVFGDNWQVAAQLQFCILKFPYSSAAVVAAKQQFNYYLTGDDFAAGYQLRDLKVICSGVDLVASNAENMRRKAGESGSKASRGARNKRRLDLMEHVEAVTGRNPDIVTLGEAVALALALKVAIQANPSLWRQGSGQAKEYLDEIRRGEAGDDLQQRYRAIFGETA